MQPKIEKIIRLFEQGHTFTAFDTETTGLQSKLDKVIEIGAIKFNKDGIIDNFSTLINPQRPLPNICIQLSGITENMIIDKPDIAKIMPGFLSFIDESILIAHNANFDVGFINAECLYSHLSSIPNCCLPAIDTVCLTRKVFPSIGTYKLQFLAKYFNIDSGKAHRAYDDARVCMEIFLKCVKQFNALNHVEL